MNTKHSSRRRRRHRARILVEAVEPRLLLATDILSYHGGELTANGVNPYEIQLTPGNVNTLSFGKQFTTDVRDTPNLAGLPSYETPSGTDYASANGQIYGEPLVKTGVNITTGPFQGVHDVVFVATEMDSLFAIDANGGNILWKDSFITNASGNPNPLNANIVAGVTAVPGGAGTEINTPDVAPWIGIMGTPVIDPSSGYIYALAKTREVHNGDQKDPHYVYTLHKVRMSDGLDTSVVIGDTTLGYSNPGAPTYTYNSGPYVLGSGDGATTVGGQSRIYFNAVRQMNRPGLIINNGRIYIEFASHGDNQPYHGWILTYDPTTLAINGAFNTTPNSSEGEAGIWQGGGYGSFDSDGYLYVETGNGKFDGSNGSGHTGAITGLDANGFPINGDYGDSFLKIALDPTTTQGNQGTNKNGWGLKVVDYFSPYNNLDLDSADKDLGSGGPIVLPDSAGGTSGLHLLVGSGKEGKIYLINRDNMGKFGNSDNVVQTIGSAINGSLDTPAFFNGRLYYTSAYGGPGISWQVSNGKIITASGVQTTPDQYIFPGSSPMITANGTLNGIAWMIDKGGQLRAYDAENLSDELWNSSQNSTRDSLGSAVKFAVATPVNGRVYAGTSGFLLSYGPPVPPTSPPADPSGLTAIPTGAATIELTWSDKSSNEDGFKIERSTDNQHFTEIGSAGVNQTVYLDSNLSAQQTYYYRIRAYNSFNGLSYSNYTASANATTLASGLQAPVNLYTFDEGNGSIAGDGVGGNNGALSGSVPPTWVTGRVGSDALSFTGNGSYNQTNQSAVVLAHSLAPVLGSTSSLAFWIKTTQVGSNTSWAAPAVTGVEQNNGDNDIGWGYIDGTGHIGIYVGDSGSVLSTVAINNGQWHHIAISRNASTGAISLYLDGVLNKTGTLQSGNKTSSFAAIGELSIVAGDGTTLMGGNFFNGQLDDVRVYSQIIDPSEVAGLALAPSAPNNLVVNPASGTELDLSWNDVATSETGYKVERSDNGGPWVQIQLLPANTTSYDDVNLLQNTPYSYRVRATNSAGDSAYSNTVNTSTPIAPVTPTNAMTTLVGSNEVDLKWNDNAGNEDGYKVLRRVGEAEFAQIGSLPPNSTTFQDKTVQPNISYDYHIQAYNIAGYSDFTGLTVTTLAATPAGVTLSVAAGSITVSWAAATGADSYNVYRGNTSGGENPTPIATDVTGTSFLDNHVTDGQVYYYQVTALNDDDTESPRSAEANNSPVQPPTANPDSATINQNQATAINVLANDTDSSGTIDPTTVAITAPAGHGTLSVNPTTGSVTYTPASNYTGTDQFNYTVKDTQGHVSSPALVTLNVNSLQIVYVSSLTPTSAVNGWGPYEKDHSNGENAAGDGHTITLNGVTYAKGLGVHANSDISYNLSGGNYVEFDSDIGVDDEVTANSTIVFQVYVDGVSKYTSPVMTPTSTTISIPAINVAGATTLRLVVSDAGDGNNSDHGDWAGARLLQSASPPVSPPPPGTTTYVSDLPLTVTANGWGPPEKDHSNGEQGANDGHTITLNGQTYLKGIGVHANSDISINLAGGSYVEFDSDIGVDDEVTASSTIVFQVYVDGVSKYSSPVMTPTSATISIPAINVTGATTLRLVVSDAGDGITSDHGDWANARLVSGATTASPAAPTGLSANFNSNTSKVQLNWTDASSNETGFRVERRLGTTGTWAAVNSSLPAGTQSFTDPTVLAGNTTYYYRVFAFNGGVDSLESNEFPITTPPALVPVLLSNAIWATATNGWGPVEKDQSNGETAAGDGHAISIRGKTYPKGLGVHGVSDITYSIGGLYKTFASDIGIDDETAGKGSVDFQIYLNGASTPAYDSGTVRGTDPVKSVSLNTTGAQTLRLVVTNAGDGADNDHADWAGAQLIS